MIASTRQSVSRDLQSSCRMSSAPWVVSAFASRRCLRPRMARQAGVILSRVALRGCLIVEGERRAFSEGPVQLDDDVAGGRTPKPRQLPPQLPLR